MQLSDILNGLNRRGFLRATGGAAMGLAKKHPAVKIAKMLGKAKGVGEGIASLSDEELMETPESEWLDKISPQRRARIFKNNPDYVSNEMFMKLYTISQYGPDYEQTGPVIKAITALGKKAGHDTGKLLMQRLSGELRDFASSLSPEEYVDMANKMMRANRQFDLGASNKEMREAFKENSKYIGERWRREQEEPEDFEEEPGEEPDKSRPQWAPEKYAGILSIA